MDNSSSVNLDEWRNYFKLPCFDIFDIINHAIMVAATDYPIDFKQKRDQIAESLFTCTNIKCSGSEKTKIPPNGVENIDVKLKSSVAGCWSIDTKESKVNDNANQRQLATNNMNINQLEEIDEFTRIIDEEKKLCYEVLRIKEILDHGAKEADIVICELLKFLKRTGLTYEILKDTGIGKTVNALRNHGSKDVRDFARALFKDWKAIVDREWYQTKDAIAVVVNECEIKPGFAEEHHGLPISPIDDLYLNNLTIDPTLDDNLEFLNGKDGLENPSKDVKYSNNQVNFTNTHLVNRNISIQIPNSNKDSSTCPKNKLIEKKTHKSKQNQQLKRNMTPNREFIPTKPTPVVQPKAPSQQSIPSGQKPIVLGKPSRLEFTLSRTKQSESIPVRAKSVIQPKPTNPECIPSRLMPVVQPQPPSHGSILRRPKHASLPKIKNEIMVQRDVVQKKPVKPQHDVNISSKRNLDGTCNEVSTRDKLETSKRKLQERYQEVDNAKKQRTIKVVEEGMDLNKQRRPNTKTAMKWNMSN